MQAARLIKRFLRLPAAPLNVFVVHGRNTALRNELCTYIRDELCLGAPVVLEEQPSLGMTIFEKFEHYGHDADIIFVLLTPDDVGGLFGSSQSEAPRARQNVIFELAYFLGFIRRRAARVVLLKSGDLDLPSDIHGLVYVDISAGIQAADAEIQKELHLWL
jgi:predicted nucleotide-binding protein